MFESIEIKNFKGIKNLTLNNLKGINLITGKNGTCKTLLLESIFINCFPSDIHSIFKSNSTRNFNIISTDVLKSFFYKFNTKENIKFKIKHYSKQEHQLDISFGAVDDHNISTSAALTVKAFFNSGLQMENKAIFHNGKATFYTSPDPYGASACFFLHSSASWLFEIPIGLESILINRQTEKLIKILKILDPTVKNIFLGDNKFIYIDCGFESLIPLNYFGISFISVLAVASYMINMPQGVILIDSLDFLSLEYRDAVLIALFKLAAEQKNQLFVASSNPEMYKAFMICGSKASIGDNIRIIRTDKKGDDIVLSNLK